MKNVSIMEYVKFCEKNNLKKHDLKNLEMFYILNYKRKEDK